MELQYKDKKRLLKAALGEIPADLCVKNVRLVNVFTGEILPADVYVCDGFVCHVEYDDFSTCNANEIYDAQGQFMTPGFLDAHMHIESSMLTPRHFAEVSVPWGTTTIITDPHEIGNVWGMEGVRYMHENSNDVPQRQFIDIPSCVPAVPSIEISGADFLAEQIEELSSLDRVIGLAEVMDFLAVMHGDDRMMDIIDVAKKKGLYIQGHAPFLSGRSLSAYLCGGPRTCHESRSSYEGLEKMRQGMYVDMRESSMSKNVNTVWDGVKDFTYFDTLCVCTDDRESDDLLKLGHINDVLRVVIAHGMDPVLAIKCATINIAREIHFDNIGAVAPGYAADMVLMPDLREMNPSAVFYEGKLVAKNQKLLVPIEDRAYDLENRNSVNVVRSLTAEDLRIKAPIANGTVKVNVLTYLTHMLSSTESVVEELPVKDGYLDLSGDPDLNYVAVINRYGHDRMAVHVVRRFGTDHGALASTVSHDSHNLTCVYDTAENGLLAIQKLLEVGGGMCAVEDGQILHTLALPVGGLMSVKHASELSVDATAMKEADRRLGLTQMPNPLLRIVSLALPVIPKAKMSDAGLIDVGTKTIIPLFAKEK